MDSSLPETEIRRIYLDALDRAMRHAAVHVSRDEAYDVAHHVASAVVKRYGDAHNGDRSIAIGPVNEIDAFVHRAVLNRIRELWRGGRRRLAVETSYEKERTAVAPAWTQPGSDIESRELHRVIEAAIAAMP